MAAGWVQSNTATGTSTSTPTVTLAAAPTAGNVLVAFIDTASAVIPPTIAGWTASTGVSSGSGATAKGGRTYYRVVQAGDSATISASATLANWKINVSEFSGIDNTTPVEGFAASADLLDASSTTIATSSLTPTASTARWIMCQSMTRTAAGTWSNQQIGGTTTGVNVRDATGNGSSITSTNYDRYIASTSGSYSGVATTSSAAVGIGHIVMLVEAAAGVTVSPRRPTVVLQAVGRAANW